MLVTACKLIIILAMGQVGECRLGVGVSYYGESAAMDTIAARVEFGQIDPADLSQADGYASSTNCKLVGQTVWAKPRQSDEWRSLVIIDCPAPLTAREQMFARFYPYLVDTETYRLWNDASQNEVRVDVVSEGGGINE